MSSDSSDQPTVDPGQTPPPRGKGKWLVALGLLGVAIFMYVSLFYKIAHFGP